MNKEKLQRIEQIFYGILSINMIFYFVLRKNDLINNIYIKMISKFLFIVFCIYLILKGVIELYKIIIKRDIEKIKVGKILLELLSMIAGVLGLIYLI